MTLEDFLDSVPSDATVEVYSKDGEHLVSYCYIDDSSFHQIAPFFKREVIKNLSTADGSITVYVDDPVLTPGAEPLYQADVYQGTFVSPQEESEWSFDWRNRERKVSPRQLAIIINNIQIYNKVRRARWPEDPRQLLSYEASQAIDAIFEERGKGKGKKKGAPEGGKSDVR